MFRMYASNSHSYTHLILALGIVSEPTIWVFITSEYPGIPDIGLATISSIQKALYRHTKQVFKGYTYENAKTSS